MKIMKNDKITPFSADLLEGSWRKTSKATVVEEGTKEAKLEEIQELVLSHLQAVHKSNYQSPYKGCQWTATARVNRIPMRLQR